MAPSHKLEESFKDSFKRNGVDRLASDGDLFQKTVRLAYENPSLRPHLLPIISEKVAGTVGEDLGKSLQGLTDKFREQEKKYHAAAKSLIEARYQKIVSSLQTMGYSVDLGFSYGRMSLHHDPPFAMKIGFSDPKGREKEQVEKDLKKIGAVGILTDMKDRKPFNYRWNLQIMGRILS